MFVVGLSVGYPHHFWYLLLDQLMPKKCLRTVCLKILADQLIAAPFFAVTFFYGMGLLQGKGLKECWIEFAQKFAYIYAVSAHIEKISLVTFFYDNYI